MKKQIIINVVKYDVRDKLENDNIRFRCHIMHNPCKAKTSRELHLFYAVTICLLHGAKSCVDYGSYRT